MTAHLRFERHVLPHLDAGYNLARWLTCNAHDADDVVQEACVRALRYIETLRPDAAKSWFLTIVRHAFYDWADANRDPRQQSDEGLSELADTAGLTPEAAAVLKDQRRLLMQAVAALPVGLREVLVLRELEELSYQDIATMIGAPIGTVMSRLSRARSTLIKTSDALQAGLARAKEPS